jgi:hypothetical protein
LILLAALLLIERKRGGSRGAIHNKFAEQQTSITSDESSLSGLGPPILATADPDAATRVEMGSISREHFLDAVNEVNMAAVSGIAKYFKAGTRRSQCVKCSFF